MHHDYACIRRRIDEAPKWFDEHAVPRYERFVPEDVADIYAKEAVLLEIACQACARVFHVCMTLGAVSMAESTLALQVKTGTIHYGDPPNVGCCPSGVTMNSVPKRVLEFWRKTEQCNWRRARKLEIGIRYEP